MTLLGAILAVIGFLVFVFPFPYYEYGQDMKRPWMACLMFPGFVAVVLGLYAFFDWAAGVKL